MKHLPLFLIICLGLIGCTNDQLETALASQSNEKKSQLVIDKNPKDLNSISAFEEYSKTSQSFREFEEYFYSHVINRHGEMNNTAALLFFSKISNPTFGYLDEMSKEDIDKYARIFVQTSEPNPITAYRLFKHIKEVQLWNEDEINKAAETVISNATARKNTFPDGTKAKELFEENIDLLKKEIVTHGS